MPVMCLKNKCVPLFPVLLLFSSFSFVGNCSAEQAVAIGYGSGMGNGTGAGRIEDKQNIKKQNPHLPVLLCPALPIDDYDPHLGLSDGCVVKSSCTADLISKVESLVSKGREGES